MIFLEGAIRSTATSSIIISEQAILPIQKFQGKVSRICVVLYALGRPSHPYLSFVEEAP